MNENHMEIYIYIKIITNMPSIGFVIHKVGLTFLRKRELSQGKNNDYVLRVNLKILPAD